MYGYQFIVVLFFRNLLSFFERLIVYDQRKVMIVFCLRKYIDNDYVEIYVFVLVIYYYDWVIMCGLFKLID